MNCLYVSRADAHYSGHGFSSHDLDLCFERPWPMCDLSVVILMPNQMQREVHRQNHDWVWISHWESVFLYIFIIVDISLNLFTELQIGMRKDKHTFVPFENRTKIYFENWNYWNGSQKRKKTVLDSKIHVPSQCCSLNITVSPVYTLCFFTLTLLYVAI